MVRLTVAEARDLDRLRRLYGGLSRSQMIRGLIRDEVARQHKERAS